ncbi:PLP-dependent aminotransferase family protein [Amphibiibacter pelophylacis]|uniref:PLP-dependent aminotransferase family protein n=1 Tax=Amphibiibacter pelophylacis TaxID=1799477 RepID=A0ACC6P2X0_9BURK
MSDSPLPGWAVSRGGDTPLPEQVARTLLRHMDEHQLPAGSRLPSIRRLASQTGASRFSVVEAYDRLMARGVVEARQGMGFFVRRPPQPEPETRSEPVPRQLDTGRQDVQWLLQQVLQRELPLPPALLDSRLLRSAQRSVLRHSHDEDAPAYGHPLGLPELRAQLARQLAAADIPVHPDRNLLLTHGVTHALDLVLRHHVQPGDTVLVEDPAWFVVFGRLQAAGARVIGIRRGPQGPDLAQLEDMAREHRPRLFIVNSGLHNPTGYSLSLGHAVDVLDIAQRHDLLIFEDDTWSDLLPRPPVRLAALDRCRRVLLAGGYAKLISPTLRVGYLAAAPEQIAALTGLKLLTGLTSCAHSEAVVHQVLAEGQFRRHLQRLQTRLQQARRVAQAQAARLGLHPAHPEASHGPFLWLDTGRSSLTLSQTLASAGVVAAPGSLFSPQRQDSTWLRLSVLTPPPHWELIGSALARM